MAAAVILLLSPATAESVGATTLAQENTHLESERRVPEPEVNTPEPLPGGWVWPLDPRPQVVRGFEAPQQHWGPGHRGVDLLGQEQQEVRAAGAGTTTFAGVLAGRGVVTVSHGALRTTYEPLEVHVNVGQDVEAGEVLGLLTPTLSHCAPQACLHWGLLRGDSYLDPLGLLATGPPRLLPLHDPAVRSDRGPQDDEASPADRDAEQEADDRLPQTSVPTPATVAADGRFPEVTHDGAAGETPHTNEAPTTSAGQDPGSPSSWVAAVGVGALTGLAGVGLVLARRSTPRFWSTP